MFGQGGFLFEAPRDLLTDPAPLAIDVADTPGGLHHVADVLARNKINIENSSGFVSNKRAVLVIEVKDIAGARVVLEQNKLHLLTQEEVLGL